MNDMMLQATLLTRASRLSEATALIQRMLRGKTDPGMTIGPTDDIAPTRSKPSIIDAKANNNEESDYPHLDEATFAHSRGFHALHDWPHRFKRHSGLGLQGWSQRAVPARCSALYAGLTCGRDRPGSFWYRRRRWSV
jgi:hypothetical protein